MKLPLFAYVASVTFAIPMYSGYRSWKRLGPSMKVFAVFCFYAGLHVMTEFILGGMGINNHFLLNIFDLVSFECIVFLYYRWVQPEQMKIFFQILGMAYVSYWFLEMTYIEVPTDFQVTISTSSNLLLIMSSIIILHYNARSAETKVQSLAISWIAMGAILYCGGTVVVQAMSNTVLKMGIEYFDMLWHINWGFSIITNIMYARSFWCKTF